MWEIKIAILGSQVRLQLLDSCSGSIAAETTWEDRRDLSTQLFRKLDALLRRRRLARGDIGRVHFDCDSPYFRKGKTGAIKLENLDARGKCGFTAWQAGETIAATINFALEK